MNQSHIRAAAVAALMAIATSMSAVAYARATPATKDAITSIVVEEAHKQGVPVGLALAVAKVESGFNGNALSSKGARGVMQIMPATAWEQYGVTADELWDPQTNIALGVRHLADLRRSLGRWDLALVGYYAGSGVAKYGLKKASPDIRRYVAAVLSGQRHQVAQAASIDDTSIKRLAAAERAAPPQPTSYRVKNADLTGRSRPEQAFNDQRDRSQPIVLANATPPSSFFRW